MGSKHHRSSFRITSLSPDQVSVTAQTLMSTKPSGRASSRTVSSVMSVGIFADFLGHETQTAAVGLDLLAKRDKGTSQFCLAGREDVHKLGMIRQVLRKRHPLRQRLDEGEIFPRCVDDVNLGARLDPELRSQGLSRIPSHRFSPPRPVSYRSPVFLESTFWLWLLRGLGPGLLIGWSDSIFVSTSRPVF